LEPGAVFLKLFAIISSSCGFTWSIQTASLIHWIILELILIKMPSSSWLHDTFQPRNVVSIIPTLQTHCFQWSLLFQNYQVEFWMIRNKLRFHLLSQYWVNSFQHKSLLPPAVSFPTSSSARLSRLLDDSGRTISPRSRKIRGISWMKRHYNCSSGRFIR
jgi:hypothetical protein